MDSQYVYWSEQYWGPDQTKQQAPTGVVARARKDGRGDSEVIASGLVQPCGVALDADEVYWTVTPMGGGGVDAAFAAPKAGGAARTVISSADSISGTPCQLVITDGFLVANGGGRLIVKSADGTGSVSTVGNEIDGGSINYNINELGLAAKGGTVWWSAGSEIRRVETSQWAGDELVADSARITSLALADEWVYWVTASKSSSNDELDSYVRRADPQGGDAEDFSQVADSIGDVVADDDYVYWSESSEHLLYRAEH
jgi:hypothetical protein